jgi:CheY-like chemotaxis protein
MSDSAAAKQVLVVDDDPAIRDFLTEILKDEGYAVVAAADGQEALDRLQEPSLTPCLIVLDLMMPKMNGWQFRAAQQHDPALTSIPVVVLSARPDIATEAAMVGVNAYLPKPIDLNILVDIVARFCG